MKNQGTDMKGGAKGIHDFKKQQENNLSFASLRDVLMKTCFN